MLPIEFHDRIPIGRKPLLVSPLCIGCVQSPGLVLDAFEAGINFFFLTTDMHWPFYEELRQGIAQLLRSGVRREEIVVAGVTYVAQPEFLMVPFMEAAEAVPGLGGVDLFIAGGCYEQDLAPNGRIDTFCRRVSNPDESARQASAIATAAGASFHSRAAALEAINQGRIDIAFTRYNARNFGAHFDLHPHIDPASACKVFNFKSCMGYVPAGYLASIGSPDAWEPTLVDHYRMVLSEPKMDGILCAPSSREQLHAMREALRLGPMEEEDIGHMIAIAQAYYNGANLTAKDQGETGAVE